MSDQLSYEPAGESVRAVPSRLDVAVIALRLIGIYILVQAALLAAMLIPGVVGVFSLSTVLEELVFPLVLIAGVAGVGVCLLVFSEWIGRRILPRDGGGPAEGASDSLTWQAIAFAVLGVYLVAESMPGIVANTVYGFNESGIMGAQRLSDLVQIVVGVVLFFQARGLAGLWHKLRTAGTHPVE